MVFVKVRETYDLHTITGKMSMIGIHTPKAQIIKDNYPGLLMQCKAYRPVSCDVRIACASTLPADPLQVSTTSGDIAPEDLFNPILYKACTNIGMSQIEARIISAGFNEASTVGEVDGNTAYVDNDTVTGYDDEFDVYYGLLSDTNQWRHASPQAGFEMKGLKPLVCEMLYTVGDNKYETTLATSNNSFQFAGVQSSGSTIATVPQAFRGNFKPMPMINTTAYNATGTLSGYTSGTAESGFSDIAANANTNVPAPQIYVGCIIVPPSRLHQLYYRMVVEWTLEFSSIRSLHEITTFPGLAAIGTDTHYQTYDYSTAKSVSSVSGTVLANDTTMVSTTTDITKVM